MKKHDIYWVPKESTDEANVKKKFDNLRHTNGIVKLHDDFQFQSNGYEEIDMIQEWQLEFEHYDEDDSSDDKYNAIYKTFFTKEAFKQIRSISPYRNGNNFQYKEETKRLLQAKEVLLALLVNAKSVSYHKLSLHDYCWPDGELSCEYEHCGDDLDSGDARYEAALKIRMPDGSKYEVIIEDRTTKLFEPMDYEE